MLFKNKVYITILIGLLISLILSFYYISKFDVYEISSDNIKNHHMIKGDPKKYWYNADKLGKEINDGKSFFKTGEEYEFSYLPEKIIFLFSALAKLELMDEVGDVKVDQKKIFLLIFQSLLYYFVLLYFYNEIKKIYPNHTCLYIIAFLSFEPTLILFHSSFWTESIFFSIQIIFLTLIIKNSKKFKINFVAGIFLGILLLQRSVAMLYLFPVIIYYIFIFKGKFIKPSLFLICGYSLVVLFLGFHNFSRSEVFYVSSSQSKGGFYDYMLPSLISKKENISVSMAKENLIDEKNTWIKDNQINFENEKDVLKYYNHFQSKSIKLIIENPFISIKHILNKTLHYAVLDPLRHVHFFYKYEYKGEPETRYYKSKTHQNLIPYRIIYSVLFYILCFFGLLQLIRNKNKNHVLIVILSVLYFTLMTSWIGNTRYFAPCLIYLSIFFGNGLSFFKKSVHKKNLIIFKFNF